MLGGLGLFVLSLAVCTVTCSYSSRSPVDCVYSTWSSWRVQSSGRTESRTRYITTEAQNNGRPCSRSNTVESRTVGGFNSRRSPVDCAYSVWSSWTVGSSGNRESRTRYVTTEAQNNGQPCTSITEESRTVGGFNSRRSPVDCVYSMWSSWAVGSSGSRESRTRYVITEAQNNGRSCSRSNTVESRTVGGFNRRTSPVDCAYSVWSSWTVGSSGSRESRTRYIARQAQNNGRPCTSNTEEFRTVDAHSQAGPEEFIGKLLAGNSPSYSLGGGKRYTLSRDIVLVLDNTVDPVIFPYYKAFISNIVGKLCGDIGDGPQDIRMDVTSVNSMAFKKHSFTDVQSREVIQDKILRIGGSSSPVNLKPGAVYARDVLTNGQSGTRTYNNATKEVLFVTSETAHCSYDFRRSVEGLKTTATVSFIVLGRRRTRQESCLKALASYPAESHFLRLEGITEISEQSKILLSQSTVNTFCLSSIYPHRI